MTATIRYDSGIKLYGLISAWNAIEIQSILNNSIMQNSFSIRIKKSNEFNFNIVKNKKQNDAIIKPNQPKREAHGNFVSGGVKNRRFFNLSKNNQK